MLRLNPAPPRRSAAAPAAAAAAGTASARGAPGSPLSRFLQEAAFQEKERISSLQQRLLSAPQQELIPAGQAAARPGQAKGRVVDLQALVPAGHAPPQQPSRRSASAWQRLFACFTGA